MKTILTLLGTGRILALVFCALLSGLAFYLKFCIPGYSFSALVCVILIAIILFYVFMPLIGLKFPVFAGITTKIFTTVLILGLLVIGITEAVIIHKSFGDMESHAAYIVVLGAKVKAMIRRNQDNISGSSSVITVGPFLYDTHTLRLYKHGEEIILSSKENAMMKLFLDNINRIFSRKMIYEMVWGETIVDENAIMVYINRLRQKIEDDPSKPRYIQTVRGLGYRFVV